MQKANIILPPPPKLNFEPGNTFLPRSRIIFKAYVY